MAATSSSIPTGTLPSTSSHPASHRDRDMNDEEEVDYGDRDGEEMTDEDRELEAMKARVREMEAEAAKLREMQAVAEKEMAGASRTASPSAGDGASSAAQEHMTPEEKEEVDGRSIYVGNVDYGATPEELQQHFASCGSINRVTILCDKYSGHPKGYAYVEFADPSIVDVSLSLNESMFRGRLLKVTAKRTNLPSFMLGGARGRGGRGRPYRGGRGGFRGGYNPYGGGPPRGRGRGRGGYNHY